MRRLTKLYLKLNMQADSDTDTASDEPDSEVLVRLPPELLHIIFACADKSTLSSCSLAAHSWLDLARRYLFDAIHYRAHSGLDNLVAGGGLPLLDLLEFLEKTPFIRPHIRALSFKMMISGQTDSEAFCSLERGDNVLRSAPPDVLYAILRLLPNLQSLVAHNLYLGDLTLTQALVLANGPAIGRLETLHIDDQYLSEECGSLILREPNPAVQLLSFFGSVENLEIRRIHHTRFNPAVDAWPYRRTRVRHLCANKAIYARDLLMADLNSLESYTYDPMLPNGMSHITRFMAATRNNLRHVKLPILSPFPNSGYVRRAIVRFSRIDLSVLQQLQSACFVLHGLTFAGHEAHTGGVGLFTPAYTFVIRTLSSLPDTLREFTLELRWDDTDQFGKVTQPPSEDVARIDWSDLDDVLARRVAERGLQTVRIVLKQFLKPLVIKSYVEMALPRICAIGALVVV